jgi:phosphatidylglycerol:prolipoprotein diacylglycerol transferase
MHPILVELGTFSIKTYGFFIAIAFLAGVGLALREARRLGYDPQLILDLAFYMIIAAIVGSRLFYVAGNLSYYRQSPLDMFKVWQGGLTFFGGFILAVAVCAWMTRRRGLGIWPVFDLFAPSLALGNIFGRIGCFFAGCCYGTPSSLPWAVTFIDPQSLAHLHVPLHPTQLYAAGAALLMFLVLFGLRTRKAFDGQLCLLWVFLYSASRLVIEPFRGDVRADLLFNAYPASQVLAAALAVASLVLYPIMAARAKKRKK